MGNNGIYWIDGAPEIQEDSIKFLGVNSCISTAFPGIGVINRRNVELSTHSAFQPEFKSDFLVTHRIPIHIEKRKHSLNNQPSTEKP